MDVMKVFAPILPTTSEIAFYLEKIELSGQYSNSGPLVQLLEQRIAGHLGISPENVAVCSSGTTALQGAVATSNAKGNWELPAWTFTATPGALLQAGSSGKFVDVDINQRAVFTEGVSNVIDVLPFGDGYLPENNSSKRNLKIIDAAASFDACESFQFPENHDLGVMISLHATKTLPAGEGGVFFSNNAAWVAEFRKWGNFGMWGSRVSQIPGTNAKMSEFTAAIANASLDNWPKYKEGWRKQREKSSEVIADLDEFLTPSSTHGYVSPYWNILLNNYEERSRLELMFEKQMIETRRWWGDGCHLMPAYQNFQRNDLEMTKTFASRMLGLPFHLGLENKDFEKIRSVLVEFAKTT